MSVAIVGGGPAGIATLDAMVHEQAFADVTLFDCKPEVLGTWVYNSLPPPPYSVAAAGSPAGSAGSAALSGALSGALPTQLPTLFPATTPPLQTPHSLNLTYAALETNVEADVMEFSYSRIPAVTLALSVYKYGPELPFRHHLVIRQWLQLLTKGHEHRIQVNTTVELAEWQGDHWILTLRRRSPDHDYWWQQRYDKLVVALGKYIHPYVPHVPGLDTFPGLLQHSQLFRSLETYRDKKVIVVGGSILAMDLVYDVLFVASKTLLLRTREGHHQVEIVGLAAFDHPQVDKRGRITRVEGLTVYFDDGSSEADVDCILYGTGYRLSVPFLPDLDTSRNRLHRVYQHVISIDNPALAFVGFVAGGLTFKVFEWQAVFAARVFAGRAHLPTKEAMEQWEQQRLARIGDNDRFNYINDDFEGYFNGLRQLAGTDGPGRQLPPYQDQWRQKLLRGYHRKRQFFERHYHSAPALPAPPALLLLESLLLESLSLALDSKL